MSKIRVAVSGAYGKMGRETVKAVQTAPDMELAAGIVRARDAQEPDYEWPLFTDVKSCLFETSPDVLVDFTDAQSARNTVLECIKYGVRPVIGTTGFSTQELLEFDQLLRREQLGGLYAPNFAIGALLMMKMAAFVAPFLSEVEIIEYHHPRKKDMPSGTARKTVEKIMHSREGKSGTKFVQSPTDQDEFNAKIPVHSVRLPGFIAHQEVIFGGHGERLTIRHDTMSRESFMPGVLLGVRSVQGVQGLIDGLEQFLF